jgi:ribosome maturation factor RimP
MAGRPPAVQRVFDAVAGKIADMGMELVDVEMVREGSSHILRLVIDKTGGVSSEDCASVSRMADPLIDQELQMHGHDFLEVSSPGLDRPLKTERDFQRNQGECIKQLTGRRSLSAEWQPARPNPSASNRKTSQSGYFYVNRSPRSGEPSYFKQHLRGAEGVQHT